MEKNELIITTAKEIFLQTYAYKLSENSYKNELKNIDEIFKSLCKTIADAIMQAQKVTQIS